MSWTDKNFEEKMSPFIDEIYKDIFKSRLSGIYRSSREKETDKKMIFMDIELAIDTHLRFKNGSILTFQEKTRRNFYEKYNDFTFEYYNDPKIKDEGEWFKLAAQLYFYGYSNESETGYSKFWILNVVKLRTRLMQNYTIKEIEEKWLRCNHPPAKANFFTIPFDILENLEDVVILKKTFNAINFQ